MFPTFDEDSAADLLQIYYGRDIKFISKKNYKFANKLNGL